MPRWIDDLVGYNQILASDGTPARRRHLLKFVGATVADDGTATVVTTSGAATDAQYFLGAANAGLPNARLPVDSSTIGWNLATPNTFVAFVKPGSILGALQFRENDVDVAQRDKLNVVNTSTITLDFTDDGVSEEVELRATRAALTGVITAAAGSNATAFGAAAPLSVLANDTNVSAVPAYLDAAAALEHLRVNAAGTALEWSVLQLQDLPTIASDTFLANVTASPAKPVALSLATIDGIGITWDSVNNRFDWDGVSIQDAGVAIATQRTVNFIDGTNTTATATNDAGNGRVNVSISVTNFPLTGLANIAANTVLANATASPAAPTAVGINANGVLGRIAGNIQSIDSLAQSSLIRGSGNLTWTASAANGVLRRDGSNDLTFGTLVTGNLGNDIVDNTKLSNMNARTIKANPTNVSADPQDVQGTTARHVFRVNPAATGLEWGDPVEVRNSAGTDQGAAYNLRFNNGDSLQSSVSAASGFAQMRYDYIGNTAEITNSTASGNLGTVDISALTCGGTYRVTAASGAFSIEGFTAKPAGFWFVFDFEEFSGDDCTLFNEDATATSTNRLALPQSADIATASTLYGIFFYTGSRWRWLGADPNRIGAVNSFVRVATGDTGQIDIQTGAAAINITSASAQNVNIVAGNDIVLTHDGGDNVIVQSNDDTGGFIIFEEAASSSPAVAAGHGMFWARNNTPCRPMFTDDNDIDGEIALVNYQDQGAVTGNLGTVNISGLKCGGTVHFDPSGATQLEGFTPVQADGFFFFVAVSNSNTFQYLNEDATATAGERLRVSGFTDSVAVRNNSAVVVRANGRWHVTVRA